MPQYEEKGKTICTVKVVNVNFAPETVSWISNIQLQAKQTNRVLRVTNAVTTMEISKNAASGKWNVRITSKLKNIEKQKQMQLVQNFN